MNASIFLNSGFIIVYLNCFNNLMLEMCCQTCKVKVVDLIEKERRKIYFQMDFSKNKSLLFIPIHFNSTTIMFAKNMTPNIVNVKPMSQNMFVHLLC